MATLIHAAGYVIVCLVLFFTLLAVIQPHHARTSSADDEGLGKAPRCAASG